jgi:hypothetical protein
VPSDDKLETLAVAGKWWGGTFYADTFMRPMFYVDPRCCGNRGEVLVLTLTRFP